ncbi:hypothetical protein K7X08_024999 [Anisodus acutangulus]|uniref:Uncharacterized protein n=1 Tax=Anisodus acutangulus TaxID=402998 RepID=A0A9Q1MC95_9SOLA|nr:hypothetical protein K7X08_024999 [Anisodus acutangulus]
MLARRLWIAILVICKTIAKAQNIIQCASSCGDIHDISFPFRLKADPLNRRFQTRNCTLPDYFKTSVPSTSTFDRALTVEYHYLKSTSGTAVTVEYHDRNVPIIYVNCLAPVNSSHYVETNFCGSPFSNSSQGHSYVAIGQGMSISDLAENCGVETVAWASSHGISGDNTSLSVIHAALTYGFELSWKRTFLCRECEDYCSTVGNGVICHRCKDNSGMNLPVPCGSHHFSVLWRLYGGIVMIVVPPFRFLCGFLFLIALIVYKLRRLHLSVYQAIEDFLQIQNNLLPIKQMKPADHPAMNKVVEMLEGDAELVQMPPSPFIAPREINAGDVIETIKISSEV